MYLPKHILYIVCQLCILSLALSSCSPTRFLRGEDNLLSSVKVKSTSPQVQASTFRQYVVQEPNTKWLGIARVPMGIYCLSGKDSTSAFNRTIRRIGESPVVYDARKTEYSRVAMEQALLGRGFVVSTVSVDTITRKRQTRVTYTIHPGRQIFVSEIDYETDNPEIAQRLDILRHTSRLYKGMPLDANLLDEERNRLIKALQDDGYYLLNKEFVTYVADTVAGGYGARLTQRFRLPVGVDSLQAYRRYGIDRVSVFENVTDTLSGYQNVKGLNVYFGRHRKLSKSIYNDYVLLRPDSIYSDRLTQLTYKGLNALAATNFTTIRFTRKDSARLDADIYVRLVKPNAVGFEIEGTNTAGDLGAAASFSYSNRNLFGGSQTLSIKLRGAYEAIRGLEGYANQDYIESSLEMNLKFPSLLLPIGNRVRRGLRAQTDISLLWSSQNRPEFHRRLLSATWGYQWNPHAAPQWRHRFDLISLGYIFMPWISDTFRREYLEGDDPRFSLIRYTYENTFIMRMGYSFTYNSLKRQSASLFQTDGYQIRFNAETAGNLLYGISTMTDMKRNGDGHYEVLGVPYSQYARFDFDFAKSLTISTRSSMAFHVALGVAIPYGNSSVVPYEKRYFAGGANSVRGWSVRRLGPGSFVGTDGNVDFINQTGNLRLDLSVEYRSHLFWKFHGALFVDAGNIWTTRDYPNQPGGQFRLNRFYREIAVAYGLGLRLNFDYFIIRFDGGMKAIDPAYQDTRGHYPILHPKFSRDFAFHFAVGLPF